MNKQDYLARKVINKGFKSIDNRNNKSSMNTFKNKSTNAYLAKLKIKQPDLDK